MLIRLARFAGAALLVSSFALGGAALARDTEDCQTKWGGAVRSYLTQNRTKGPEDSAFKPACEMEKSDKPKARVEAVLIGVKSLAKLDAKGCERFVESYVGASEPAKICQAAGGDDEALRKLISSSLPPPPQKKEKSK
jgi:hypothetical protein